MRGKKLLCLLLALILALSLCAGTGLIFAEEAEGEKTAPEETLRPDETHAPEESAAPEETAKPEESAAPEETAEPVDGAAIADWEADSEVLAEIVSFVEATADEKNSYFIPERDRIAVFDMDGTLYGERFPTYFNDWLFIQRALYDENYEAPQELKQFAQAWEDKVLKGEPLPNFDPKERYYGPQLYKGLTPEQYADVVRSFKDLPVRGFEGMTYGEGYFQPMVSLVKYLTENGYKCYVCSATYRDAVRVMMEGTLDEYIPADRVIGTDLVYEATGQMGVNPMEYDLQADDELVIAGELLVKNAKTNKVTSIQREIGKMPVLAFGNSTGDFPMGTYALQNKACHGRAYMLLCDDTERDYGDAEVAAAFKEKCEKAGFGTISMKDDFARIYTVEATAAAGAGTADYKLEQVTVLSRHNIRAPLASNGSVPTELCNYDWIDWTAAPSSLTLKGGVMETQMGQYFRQWLEAEGLFPTDYQPEDGAVRFYGNAKQRTQATARYFAAGLLPVADVTVERKTDLGTHDPVFNPILRWYSEDYAAAALKGIEALGGKRGLNAVSEGLHDDIALVMEVAGTADTFAYKDGAYGDLLKDKSEMILAEGKEPSMSGPIKTGCQLADALVLQYYEEPDALKAAFGHKLTEEDWKSISNVKDTYLQLTASTPLIAVNTAHGLLEELRSEMKTQGREFSFLCGHDVSLISVLSALGVEDYALPETIERLAPIGAKLVIEKWSNEEGEAFYALSLVYESTEQIRSNAALSLENPPMKVALSFDGLRTNADGLIAEQDLLDRFDQAIRAYDELQAEDFSQEAAA